jgi:hypothetical protein
MSDEGKDVPGRLSGIPLWLAVAVAVAVVIVAILIISRIVGPLAALLSPAEPPFFAPATLLEHREQGYGAGEWLYATEASGCDVYDWYNERATLCTLAPLVDCRPDSSVLPPLEGAYSVGYCQGSVPFGEFSLDWDIFIHDGYNDADGRTRFLLTGEVDWISQR